MNKLQEYLINAIDATVLYAPRVVLGLVLLVSGWKASGIVAGLIRKALASRKVDESLVPFLSSCVSMLIKAAVVISIISYLGIGYGDDIDKARSALRELIDADQRIHQGPEPFIVLGELADSSVNFTVRVWTDTGDYWGVFFDMQEAVKKRFDAEGISIPYPQQDVHMHQA